MRIKKEISPDSRLLIYRRRLAGETLKSIGDEFSITPECVRKIFLKISNGGSPENGKRTGRKRKTTEHQDRLIVREVRKNPKVTSEELKENLNLPISITQIKKRINEQGLNGRVSRAKPLISKKNKTKRFNWAQDYKDNPPEFWNSIIWSDESKFMLVNNARRKFVWRKKGEAFKSCNLKPTVKYGGGSVMVWGCFSSNGVGKICFIDGKMNGQMYVEILKDNLIESASILGKVDNFIFQQDNDPKHTSAAATKFFAENRIPVLPWPAQSPDMNPIEHLWQYLDDKISKSQRNNLNNFKNAIIETWNSIPSDYLEKLVSSMANRLNELYNAKGGPTRY